MRRSPNAKLRQIRDLMAEIVAEHPNLGAQTQRKVVREIEALSAELDNQVGVLSHVRRPRRFFDPSLPSTIGRLVTLALIAQDPEPLGTITDVYGSGVYAIYYHGSEPLYAAISGTETPIYVGKADPASPNAETPTQQKAQLSKRLCEHKRTIATVEAYAQAYPAKHRIGLGDFHCRRLVCATNAQLVAEQTLIDHFLPVWNSEMKICWGFSKHGDKATTRSNARSPWHVVHPGVRWALDPHLVDAKPMAQIERDIRSHFAFNLPYPNHADLVTNITNEFKQ